MKNHLLKIALLAFCFPALADVAVVVHPSNSNAIDKTFIKKVFTGKVKSFGDGASVIAINQESSSAATGEFNKKLLNKSASQLKAYWSKQIFTGKGTPPKEVPNSEEVLKLVSSNPNFIGYIDAASVNDSVKVIGVY